MIGEAHLPSLFRQLYTYHMGNVGRITAVLGVVVLAWLLRAHVVQQLPLPSFTGATAVMSYERSRVYKSKPRWVWLLYTA